MAVKRVLLDVDGVLADFLTKALGVINEKSGTAFQPSDVKEWDICSAIGMPEMWPTLRAACGEPGFCLSIDPIAGTKQAVESMIAKTEVFVVTSPMDVPNWVPERMKWLEQHFGFKKSHVVMTEAKHVIEGDILVDDKPENIDEWAKYHPNGIGLLWDAPYNQDSDKLRFNVMRVSSWEQVLDFVDGPQSSPTSFYPKHYYMPIRKRW